MRPDFITVTKTDNINVAISRNSVTLLEPTYSGSRVTLNVKYKLGNQVIIDCLAPYIEILNFLGQQ
jgi:hypothetical protein